MVDVPALTPVTTPVLVIVATAGVLEVHTPPGVPSVNVVVVPPQRVVVPDMLPALGVPPTVTVAVAAAVPQLLVNV